MGSGRILPTDGKAAAQSGSQGAQEGHKDWLAGRGAPAERHPPTPTPLPFPASSLFLPLENFLLGSTLWQFQPLCPPCRV